MSDRPFTDEDLEALKARIYKVVSVELEPFVGQKITPKRSAEIAEVLTRSEELALALLPPLSDVSITMEGGRPHMAISVFDPNRTVEEFVSNTCEPYVEPTLEGMLGAKAKLDALPRFPTRVRACERTCREIVAMLKSVAPPLETIPLGAFGDMRGLPLVADESLEIGEVEIDYNKPEDNWPG